MLRSSLPSPLVRRPQKDFSGTARNIIPSGQYGSLPVQPKADVQAKMYDALTPLFGKVTAADLIKDFKSEKLGKAGTPGPAKVEKVPRKGVRIVRDAFDVPHVYGKTHNDVVWAAGWILQEIAGCCWPRRATRRGWLRSTPRASTRST